MRYILLFLLITSCSARVQTVGGIATIAEQNKILAYQDYANSKISITGKVIDIGVDSSFEKAIVNLLEPDNISIYIFKKEKNRNLYPFIVIGDNMLSYNVAICFFHYNKSKDASRYRRRDLVTVTGTVYRFVTIGKRIIIVVDNCKDNG